MNYILYTVVVGMSFPALLSFIPSEPVVYKAEATVYYSVEQEIKEDILIENVDCSCIKSARAYGVDIPYGTNAWELIPNSSPEINSLVLLRYSLPNKSIETPYGTHVAVITDFKEEGIEVFEGNFRNPPNGCREGYRVLDWNDSAIRGFWIPEKDVDNFALQF